MSDRCGGSSPVLDTFNESLAKLLAKIENVLLIAFKKGISVGLAGTTPAVY